jgi:hypothetical protein
VENVELCEVFEVTDDRCWCRLLLLKMLPCVPVLWCPLGNGFTAWFVALDLLGLRSDFPSNGPGAIVFMRLVMFSPPSRRGLSGANNGLGWA